jgi:hypothetical protein
MTVGRIGGGRSGIAEREAILMASKMGTLRCVHVLSMHDIHAADDCTSFYCYYSKAKNLSIQSTVQWSV